jgi:hypothetical protein
VPAVRIGRAEARPSSPYSCARPGIRYEATQNPPSAGLARAKPAYGPHSLGKEGATMSGSLVPAVDLACSARRPQNRGGRSKEAHPPQLMVV